LRARIAKAGTEFVTTAFDWDRAVRRMEEILAPGAIAGTIRRDAGVRAGRREGRRASEPRREVRELSLELGEAPRQASRSSRSDCADEAMCSAGADLRRFRGRVSTGTSSWPISLSKTDADFPGLVRRKL